MRRALNYGLLRAVAKVRDLHLIAGLQRRDVAGEIRGVVDRLTVQFGDDVAGLQTSFGGGRSRFGLVDQGAAGSLEPKPFGDILADWLNHDAEISPLHDAAVFE